MKLLYSYFAFHSGFHLVWEIVYRLRNGSTTIPHTAYMEQYFLDQVPSKILRQARAPRVFVSHLPLRQLPESFMTSQCPMLFLLRDPRAIAVSYFHHLKKLKPEMSSFRGNWNDFLHAFLNGNGIKGFDLMSGLMYMQHFYS